MSKKFELGLAVGALFGAVAGILTAPKSGEETRKDLKLKAKKVADVATQKTCEVAENAGEFVEETKEKVTEFAEGAKSKTGEVVENAKKEAGKIQKRALNTFEGAKKGFEKKV